MAYCGQCGSYVSYCGNKNPFFAETGKCDLRQIEVYPSDDCPYYRSDNNYDNKDYYDEDDDDDWQKDESAVKNTALFDNLIENYIFCIIKSTKKSLLRADFFT